jgi:hypothetical protein
MSPKGGKEGKRRSGEKEKRRRGEEEREREEKTRQDKRSEKSCTLLILLIAERMAYPPPFELEGISPVI